MIAWTLYTVAISAALGLAALAVERSLGLYRRPTRWAWVAAMAGSLAIPAILLVVPRAAPPGAADVLPPTVIEAPLVGPVADRVTEASAPGWLDLGPWLLAGWGGATLLLTLFFVRSAWRLRAERRRWPATEVAGEPVLESDSLGPAVVGVVRTRIAVPRWVRDLDEDLQRLVVVHERAHQAAADPLLLWLGVAACVAVPWCAPLWWQLRRLRLAIEVDCDRRVLAGGAPLARYGSLLLEVGRRSGGRPFALVGLFESRSFLERRIRVMTLSPLRKRWSPSIAAFAVVMAAASGIALTPIPERPSAFDLLHRGEPSESPDTWYIVVTVPDGEEISSLQGLKRFASPPDVHWIWKSIEDWRSVRGPGSCRVARSREGARLLTSEEDAGGVAFDRSHEFDEPSTCYLVLVEMPPSPVALLVRPEDRDLETAEALHSAGYRDHRGHDLRQMRVHAKRLLEGPASCGLQQEGWPGDPNARVEFRVSEDSNSPMRGGACFFLLPEDWDLTTVLVEVIDRRGATRIGDRPDAGNRRAGEADLPAVSVAEVDTPPRFERTSFDERPVCVENCNPTAILTALRERGIESTHCEAVIGIRIGVEGTVSATDILKSQGSCDPGLRAWAESTRWKPARRDGEPVAVWIAQPVTTYREPESVDSPARSGSVHVEADTDPDRMAKTALRRAMVAQEMYRSANDEYADAIELDLSPPRTITIETRSDGEGYVMVARHDDGTASFCASSETGTIVEGTDC